MINFSHMYFTTFHLVTACEPDLYVQSSRVCRWEKNGLAEIATEQSRRLSPDHAEPSDTCWVIMTRSLNQFFVELLLVSVIQLLLDALTQD